MKLIPLGDKVVVRPVDAEETTAGGIVLPDAAQEKQRQGRVLSVGDGILNQDGSRAIHEVKEGDRVLYSQYCGTEVEVDGESLLIMSENDILAIVS
ncbi:MAG TPA: co-chaperone GroES [Pirellulales bacterium]|jgi:chaperonin GroES|nr:co-chaperone GroES [Pirellulales bacterium]|tara:strand:+ start:187 stop:474 length:288 start_codon:yes stop_codon:yes gene_type:complete